MKELIARAARQLLRSKHAVALTGAGMSTESGIPDYRGPNGVWTKNPAAEKKAYQSYHLFQRDPKAYWIERLTGDPLLGDLLAAKPNPGHLALAELEKMGILKCVITQNIDNLHQRAGSQLVIDYHGNISLLRCYSCGRRFDPAPFELDRLMAEDGLPPLCPSCTGILKLDVVHFHEAIPEDVSTASQKEVGRCDLMLICGTSAVVYPFALLPRMAKHYQSTIIEINFEMTPLTAEGISDYIIQGKTGIILPGIVEEMKKIVAER